MLAVEGLFVWYDGMKVTKEWNGIVLYILILCLVDLKEWSELFKYVVCYVQLQTPFSNVMKVKPRRRNHNQHSKEYAIPFRCGKHT